MINKKKIYIVIGIIIAIILIIFIAASQKHNNDLIYTVTREALINTFQTEGTLTIASQTQVVSPTNGIITKLYVQNNDIVKKDDPLFFAESTATDDQKKSAYANYLTVKTALDNDNAQSFALQSEMFAQWNKYFNLATNGTYQNGDGSPNVTNRTLPEFTTAQDNWLAAEANYKNQQGVIAKDQAALSSVYLSYQETQNVTVNSPVAGTVVNLQKKVGDQILAQANSPVLIIADFSNPAITAAISEENIPKIAIGQKAQIVFDALPDETFTGTVTNIDSVGTNTQGIITYNIRIDLTSLSPQLKPEMTANVIIETLRKENVLTVPNNAIIETNGNIYVQKIISGRNMQVPIGIGAKGLTKTEVTEGLSVGNQIAIPK